METGQYILRAMERDLEYLRVGETYQVTADRGYVRFQAIVDGVVTDRGTFARSSLLSTFIRQGRIAFERAIA